MENSQLPFEEQAKMRGLKQSTIDSLVGDDYDSAEAVATLTPSDMERLSIKGGQAGLLGKWIRDLAIQDATAHGAEAVATQTPSDMERLSIKGRQAENDGTGTQSETVQRKEPRTVSETSNTWDRPICLVDGQDCELNVNEKAIEILDKVPGPIVVVGVVGLYRTGKSFLLNCLAGQTGGFPLGPCTIACTKGIWAWLVAHPTRKDTSLLLLDTEGLGDMEKSDENHDMRIFTLCLLLISTMVYNSKGTIDSRALEELNFISNIADHIQVKTDKEDDEDGDFDRHLPSFVWTVRDFTLRLDKGSADYLERALKPKEGNDKRVQDYNRPRNAICKYFPSRTCYCFPFPLNDTSRLNDLASMTESQLAEGFRKVAEEFKEYIYARSETKKVNGEEVNGSAFGELVKAYVKALKSGETPCIQNAVDTTGRVVNLKAIDISLSLYATRMEKTVLPTESREVLSSAHAECEKEAVATYLKAAIFDNEREFQKQLQEKIMNEYKTICLRNEQASMSKCLKILEELSKEMDEKLQSGGYMVSGGYDAYKIDLSKLEDNFKRTPNKGVGAEESLDQFMKSKNNERASIMMADKNMTDQQKKMEEQRNLVESRERERKLQEELARKFELQELERKRSHDEHVQQQTWKIEQNQERFQKEIAAMREDYRKLLEQGYDRRAADLNRRIDRVTEKNESESSGCQIS